MINKYGCKQDPYCYEGTDILKNKLMINDENILSLVERELSELAILNINFQNPPYNLNYWCYLHQQLFSDVYSWAGNIRTIDISKGSSRFCNVARIEKESQKIFSLLDADNYLMGLDHSQLINKVAEYYTELNVIHPFREGNGRTQRLLFEHLIINCGYHISFKNISPKSWINANIAGFNCDYDPMINIFNMCIK